MFVVLAGTASVRLDGRPGTAATGDAIVVPAGVPFGLANESDQVLRTAVQHAGRPGRPGSPTAR